METDNKKPIAVIIYGMVAVGKLTGAKALQKETEYKLTHNHLTNDLVWSIFDRGTLEANTLIERLRFELYEEAVKRKVSIITTHAYSHDYVSPTGLSDPEYLKTLEGKLEAAGATTLFVHLQAEKEALLERVQGVSRQEHRKLTRVPEMMAYLDAKDFDMRTSAPVKNNLVIDNTNLSAEDVARMIIQRLQELS